MRSVRTTILPAAVERENKAPLGDTRAKSNRKYM
jgi:hypothetical protein